MHSIRTFEQTGHHTIYILICSHRAKFINHDLFEIWFPSNPSLPTSITQCAHQGSICLTASMLATTNSGQLHCVHNSSSISISLSTNSAAFLGCVSDRYNRRRLFLGLPIFTARTRYLRGFHFSTFLDVLLLIKPVYSRYSLLPMPTGLPLSIS